MRSGRLISDGQKVRRADFAFVNDGTLEALDAFVQSRSWTLQSDLTNVEVMS